MKKLVTLFLLLVIPVAVFAGSITLTTTTIVDVLIDDSTMGHIKLVNSGDESALDVRASFLLPEGLESESITVGELASNKPFEDSSEITRTSELLPGKYPAVVIVDYTDVNGYPFSTVAPGSVAYQSQTSSLVSGIISGVTLYGKTSEKLKLTVRNLDDVEHDVAVKLFLPRELKSADVERTLSIDSKEEEEITFDVSSLSALPESSYFVLASLVYEHDGKSYTSFGTGIIGVGTKTGGEGSGGIGYILLFLFIIIILQYFFRGNIKWRGKGRKSR